MLMPIVDNETFCKREAYAIPPDIFARAKQIVLDVRANGRPALENYARQFDGWEPEQPMLYSRADCEQALQNLPADKRTLLENTATRIRSFAERQRAIYTDFEMPTVVDGITTGVRHIPLDAVGCYAPGGRYPLVSSVLMAVIPARVAGVQTVTLATPNPQSSMLAAAAIAEADQVLAVGGSQAIAMLAYGADIITPCDMIVGPGNQWVAAAKQIISVDRGIDFLAGPSELTIIADDSANPAWVAADLLAQAEHDTAAIPTLVTNSSALAQSVQNELVSQLADLPEPNQTTARQALKNGAIAIVPDLGAAATIANRLAPEHLQIMTADASALAAQCRNYGGIFIGAGAAEVFGDYGIGPNHTLPTGGAGRFNAGLSVANFLKPRTFVRAINDITRDSYQNLIGETALIARLEGLECHARAAEQRINFLEG